MASADTLLMGRNTYDIVSAFPEWFYGDKPVVVLTTDPPLPREHVSFRQGALAQVLRDLWQAGAATSTWTAAIWCARGCRPGSSTS